MFSKGNKNDFKRKKLYFNLKNKPNNKYIFL